MKHTRSVLLTAALLTATTGLGTAITTSAASADAPRTSPRSSASQPQGLPAGFTAATTDVDGLQMHYVRGGQGPTLVLLHGYPQTWYMWRKVMPVLAEHFTVIAPDLRGAGATEAPADGYDKRTLAADVHGLLTQLGLTDDVRIVGHDIGTMVAYAYAAAHPAQVSRLVLTEAPLPDESLYRFPSVTPQGPGFWNFGFFTLDNGLPEQSIDGRETQWVAGFTDWLEVNKDGVTPADARVYGRALRDDAHLRASFEYFRALDEDVADNAESIRTPLPMPVLPLGAEGSLGATVGDQVQRYATDVTSTVLPDSGHWVFEERPEAAATEILDFLRN